MNRARIDFVWFIVLTLASWCGASTTSFGFGGVRQAVAGNSINIAETGIGNDRTQNCIRSAVANNCRGQNFSIHNQETGSALEHLVGVVHGGWYGCG